MIRNCSFKFIIIPQLDKYPKIVNFAQTIYGKIFFLMIFYLGTNLYVKVLNDSAPNLIIVNIILTLITFFPQYRKLLFSIGTIFSAFYYLPVFTELYMPRTTYYIMLILVFLFCISYTQLYYILRKKTKIKRPIFILYFTFSLFICILYYFKIKGYSLAYPWFFALTLAPYLIFISYSILDISSGASNDLWYQVGWYKPFGQPFHWFPFHKGTCSLIKVEAKNKAQFAIVQLKAVKLLYWGLFISIISKIYFHLNQWEINIISEFIPFTLADYFPIFPNLSSTVNLPKSLGLNPLVMWYHILSKPMAFFLIIAGNGHFFVSIIRMAGFNIYRNTYKPWAALSIVDFFNRFYYYYKEVLVSLFFIPTFTRLINSKNYRISLFISAIITVFFGNAFLHLTHDVYYLNLYGFWGIIVMYKQLFLRYFACALLIAVSLIRKKRVNKIYRVKNFLNIVFIYILFSIINVWDLKNGLSLNDFMKLVLHLFGISLL